MDLTVTAATVSALLLSANLASIPLAAWRLKPRTVMKMPPGDAPPVCVGVPSRGISCVGWSEA